MSSNIRLYDSTSESIKGASTLHDTPHIQEVAPNTEPHIITQTEVSDLIRDPYLSKIKAKLLGS